MHGIDVPAKHRVALCWASANRDESVFEAPHEVRIDRRRNPHVGFGAGPHTCIGASHARAVLHALLRQIARKVLSIDARGGVARYEEWPGYRRQIGFERLDVEFMAAK